MRENNDILDSIERYTKGKMGLEEKLVFEKELASDESLREQLEFSQIVDQMIIGNETWKLKEQMQKDLYKPKPKWGKYLAVSLFALVASAGLFFVFDKKEDKVKVASPVTVVSEKVKQAERQVDIQKKTVSAETKTAVIQEKKTSVETVTKTPEFETAVIEPNVVRTVFVSASVQTTVLSPNMASKQSVSLPDKTTSNVSLNDEVEPQSEHAPKIVESKKQQASYVFNPEYDSSWPIPYDADKQATSIKILEKGGKVFFQTTVSASQPTEWKGESNTGLVLGMGIYFFTIEYADGSVDEGSIVVTR